MTEQDKDSVKYILEVAKLAQEVLEPKQGTNDNTLVVDLISRIDKIEDFIMKYTVIKPSQSDSTEITKEEKTAVIKKRGPYKKRSTLKKGASGNVFGVKTTQKYNNCISRALKAKHFTQKQIIAEMKKKHSTLNRFTGKELLYQVRKAKWRLDTNKRRENQTGVYGDPEYYQKRRKIRMAKENKQSSE